MRIIIFLLFSLSIQADEFEKAMQLKPNIEHGKQLYRQICVHCHGSEGWGGGIYPQIAGQLKDVLIKQLADFRDGHRDNPIMRRFSSPQTLGDAQSIADVSAYVSQLPMTKNNEKNFAPNLKAGQIIYQKYCQSCHGERGEGNPSIHAPRIQAQHYSYLMRQFNWIRNGLRRNSDPEMARLINQFSAREQALVLSYVSHLPPDHPAPSGWKNPDIHFDFPERKPY